MAKPKHSYVCTECGTTTLQWSGQCGHCGAWNTLEKQLVSKPNTQRDKLSLVETSNISKLADVKSEKINRITTKIVELDRVLGGGLVYGSVTLIGGDPGIGKSTLLLQTLATLSSQLHCLYVSGEESLEQVALRAQRLAIDAPDLSLITEIQVERILDIANEKKPQVIVIDSIQTVFTETLNSMPGSTTQLRETAAQLVRYAKQTGTTLLIIGHVTKEGVLAGPRVLEHMVDTVLYFEGESDSRYRLIRAVKNRFGAVNELGVFAMLEQGLKPVSNPSAIFLSRHEQPVSGSIVSVTREGTRPLLIEVQTLVDTNHAGSPRRVTIGLEHNRLAMLLAVIHRHIGLTLHDQDVFVNIVGGVKVSETAIDLAVILAALSSFKNQPLDPHTIAIGEIGLAGEIRPVPNGQERLQEAAKHGFKKAIIPAANQPKNSKIPNMEIVAIRWVRDIMNIFQ